MFSLISVLTTFSPNSMLFFVSCTVVSVPHTHLRFVHNVTDWCSLASLFHNSSPDSSSQCLSIFSCPTLNHPSQTISFNSSACRLEFPTPNSYLISSFKFRTAHMFSICQPPIFTHPCHCLPITWSNHTSIPTTILPIHLTLKMCCPHCYNFGTSNRSLQH